MDINTLWNLGNRLCDRYEDRHSDILYTSFDVRREGYFKATNSISVSITHLESKFKYKSLYKDVEDIELDDVKNLFKETLESEGV